MVSYLTGEGPLDDLPETLTESMEQLENKEELISLACMNVIMPTAMVTLHKDEELSNSSKMTASKGKKVAGVLMKYDEMKAQCDAICAVAKEQATESSNINKVSTLYAPDISISRSNQDQQSFLTFPSLTCHYYTSIGLTSLKSGDMVQSRREILPLRWLSYWANEEVCSLPSEEVRNKYTDEDEVF